MRETIQDARPSHCPVQDARKTPHCATIHSWTSVAIQIPLLEAGARALQLPCFALQDGSQRAVPPELHGLGLCCWRRNRLQLEAGEDHRSVEVCDSLGGGVRWHHVHVALCEFEADIVQPLCSRLGNAPALISILRQFKVSRSIWRFGSSEKSNYAPLIVDTLLTLEWGLLRPLFVVLSWGWDVNL